MDRVLRIAGIAFAVVGALLLLAAASLWWWAGTQYSLDWAIARAAQSQSLQVEGAQGSLRRGLKARRLQWAQDGLKVEAFDAELAWRPLALVRDTLWITRLHAARLSVEDRRPPRPGGGAPASLALPLRVAVDDVRIGQAQWLSAARDVALGDVAGAYGFDGAAHHVTLSHASFLQGVYSGELSLGVGRTMPLSVALQGRLTAQVPATTASAPLTFTATIQGTLAEMQARAQLQGTPDSPTAGASATATARLRPWDAQPVPEAQAQFQRLDVGALWPQAPHTLLDGKLELKPEGAAWIATVDATNAAPGPWDKRRLPVDQFTANGEWRPGGVALVRELHARAAGGTVDANGELRGANEWTLAAKVAKVDPAAIHTHFASLPIGGTVHLQGSAAAIAFDVNLRSAGAPANATVAALELRSARAKGRWRAGTWSLPLLDVRTSDASVQAALELQPNAKAGSGRASLDAPGLQLRAEGRLAERSGAGQLDMRASDLARATQWLSRWPGAPRDALGRIASGRADAQLAWQGGWEDPTVQARVTAPLLVLGGPSPWTVRDATLALDGRLAQARLQLHARAEQDQRRTVLDVAGQAGRQGADWQGQLETLDVSWSDPSIGNGAWSLALQRAFAWRWSAGRLEAGAGAALLKSPRASDAPAQVSWDPVRWGGGELRTSGRVAGLPLAWIELVGGPQLAGTAVSGDMVFDAQWDAQLGATTRIRASLARSRGDVTVLAENAEGNSVRVAAGVREARLAVESNGEAVTATLRWDSEHGGMAEGRLATRLAPGGAAGWQWPENAPLEGTLRARLPRIGVWSLLAPPGWRLRGSLVADVAIAGTRADPRLNGTLAADDLALRSVVDGVEMQGGRLRARLEDRRMRIDEFVLRGSGANGGLLSATGEGTWTSSGPQASMSAQLTKLRASIRSDRQVTLSGRVEARRDENGTAVSGNLHIDQALVVLPDQGTPKLGADVVVRNAAAPITRQEARAVEQAAKKPAERLQVAVDVDLGDDFRVRGMGVDTRLRGTLALSGEALAQPRIVGTITARGGEYRAYGQRLEIERGVLRFNGPMDNPALDVLAIRPNITQRVGVQVSGNALSPLVRLYSEPDLPDAEKLAWLVTGRAAPATGAESALVQQAALALLASRAGGSKQGVAASLGLDELSFRREGAEGPAVTVGKRFGEHFYAAYERGLSGAIGTLYIFYDVSRKLTVRAQAGERQALDLIYTLAFD